MPTYTRAPYSVTVDTAGKIFVKTGDMLSKYSWAIYGNYTTLSVFYRVNGGGSPMPIVNKDLIYAGETLIHMPDYKPGGNGNGGASPATGGFVHHPTADYKLIQVQGHPVYLSPETVADGALMNAVISQLSADLSVISTVLPKAALTQLAHVPFWVEHDNPDVASIEFHSSSAWLQNHGYNLDKAKSIEIGNPSNFLAWHADQPFMTLHELAHAYQDRVSLYSHVKLMNAYLLAVSSHKYESVPYIRGGKARAYALNNVAEYFAELSEAYFGKNDYYPFVRSDLAAFDPVGFQMIEELWRVR